LPIGFDEFYRVLTAKDPIGLKAGAVNLFTYSVGDPINLYDPSGLLSRDDYVTIATSSADLALAYRSIPQLTSPASAAIVSTSIILDKTNILSTFVPSSQGKDIASTALNIGGAAAAVVGGSAVSVAGSGFALGYGLGSWADRKFGVGDYWVTKIFDWLHPRKPCP
jgi:hypothetical protein